MAEGTDERIPSYVMEALLDSFSESDTDSDIGDISGDFSQSGNANESQPDLLASYSDVASDDDSTVDETNHLGTVLSFLNDDDLLEYDFKKNETVHVNPVFQPVSPPGPTCASPPGRGTALDYFQLFYDDSFLGAIVDFTNRNAATRQLAGDKSYGQWADISVQELEGLLCSASTNRNKFQRQNPHCMGRPQRQDVAARNAGNFACIHSQPLPPDHEIPALL